jgi:SAM-dependent methyltransferase
LVTEARKTNAIRSPAFMQRHFSGRVLDIGCGDDRVVPHAQPFDRPHGDAGRILDHLAPAQFDCVHSSHCLEHMPDVPGALAQWWALVKPGGCLVLVVPHEDLYEQGVWPSLFNSDHKATFRLDRQDSWSPVSYDLRTLVSALPDAEVEEVVIQDHGYDHRLLRPVGAWGRWLYRAGSWRSAMLFRLFGRAAAVRRLDGLMTRLEQGLGRPVAQTDGPALAQIQAVVRRRPAISAPLPH